MDTKEKNSVKVEDMFAAGMHFGRPISLKHPSMSSFLFGSRNGVDLFDLDKTKVKLDEARDFARKLGAEKKAILFVGTKMEVAGIVKKFAERIGMPYVNSRWLGGTLTNFPEIKRRIEYFNDTTALVAKGGDKTLTKKENLLIEKNLKKAEEFFTGIKDMKMKPAALVVVDSNKEKTAVDEARKIKIAVISLMNSDCKIGDVDYPVPGNGSSSLSVNYFVEEITKAYEEGGKEAEKEIPKA